MSVSRKYCYSPLVLVLSTNSDIDISIVIYIVNEMILVHQLLLTLVVFTGVCNIYSIVYVYSLYVNEDV